MVSAGERRSAADVLAKAKAKTERVRLLLDGDLLDQHEQLAAELAALGEGSDQMTELSERILALEEEMKAAEVEFVFKGIGRGRWRAMIADHPPTEEQRAQGAEFNIDTFPFVAMAACLDEPRMTIDELVELNDRALNEVQFSLLWAGCLKAALGTGAALPSSEAARRHLANVRPNSELQLN